MENQKDSRRVKELLADREWRLDNLYYIQNEAGEEIQFVRNEAQMQLWQRLWYLNAILKGRQLGFSTFIAIFILDYCLFNSNTAAGIVDYTLTDAKAKLAKIKFAYERLPAALQRAVPLVKASTEELVWANGSSVKVGTSHRGGTLQILHVSEFGKISARYPDVAEEIRTGAFGTVHSGQFIFVESTAEGVGGEFHDLVKTAKDLQDRGAELTPMDFSLQFFPWQDHPGYAQRPTGPFTTEMQEYFAEMSAKHGIVLNEDQKGWYAKKLEQIGGNRNRMWKEYPTCLDEPFQVSLEGAYFRRQMTKMRVDGRICTKLFDPSRPVNTFWDIGVNDETAIWFHQSDGVRNRLIDYYENSGESVEHYAGVLQAKARKRKFVYRTHYGPHDLGDRSWTNPNAATRKAVAQQHGIEFEVVPRVMFKADSIEAVRAFLGVTWIDEEHCARGIQCLDNYTKQWNERLATWRDEPLHNWASNGADALQCGAMGITPDPVVNRPRSRPRPKRSAWAA